MPTLSLHTLPLPTHSLPAHPPFWYELHHCLLHLSLSIAVITKGKYSELEAGALPSLVALMGDTESEVRLNSIKVVSVV